VSKSILRRAIHNLKRGVISDRLAYKQKQRRHAKQMAWWDERRGSDGFVEIDIRNQTKFRLYFDSDLCRMIYSGGFEESELAFVEAFLRPGDTFVDVGANVGLFSVVAGRIIGPTGKLIAFEPVSKTFRRLQENLQINQFNHVTANNLALSSAPGSFDMVVSVGDKDAWNSMAQPYVDGETKTETVQLTTWDAYASTNALTGQVALMKIDVEGWEHHVLQGGHKLLSVTDAPVLQVEFTDAAAKSAGSSTLELYRAIRGLGYELYRFDESHRSLTPEPEQASWGYCNLFAIKDVEGARARLAHSSP